MIVINFKNYVYGKKAIVLAQLIEKYIPKAIVAVPTADIFEISTKTRLKVYSQHVDLVPKKRGTGFTTAKDVHEAGAIGTMLNHSEHKLSYSIIKKTIASCEREKLKVIICAASLAAATGLKQLKPYAIAFEDPVLIASGKSITTYQSNKVRKFVSLLRKTNIIPLCGSGVHSRKDILAAHKLGCKGVLIASAIATAIKPQKILKEIADLV